VTCGSSGVRRRRATARPPPWPALRWSSVKLAGQAAAEHRTIGAWRGGADDREPSGVRWNESQAVTCWLRQRKSRATTDIWLHSARVQQRARIRGHTSGTSADY
jgi:hypothetical protein